MRKKGFTLVELMVIILVLGIVASVVVPIVIPKLTKPKSEKEEDKTYSLYEITEVGFNGFFITASYSNDPNYGYVDSLNQAVEQLEFKGYEIKTIVPCHYLPTNNQLQSIWVRAEKKEKLE